MGWRVPLVEGKGKEGKDGTGFLLRLGQAITAGWKDLEQGIAFHCAGSSLITRSL